MSWDEIRLESEVAREFALAQQLARSVVVRESDRRSHPPPATKQETPREHGPRRRIGRALTMTDAIERLMQQANPGEDAAQCLDRIITERARLAGAVLDAWACNSITPLNDFVTLEGDIAKVRVPPRRAP